MYLLVVENSLLKLAVTRRNLSPTINSVAMAAKFELKSLILSMVADVVA